MTYRKNDIINFVSIILLTLIAVYAVDPQLEKFKYAWSLAPALLIAKYHKSMQKMIFFLLLIFSIYTIIGSAYGRLSFARVSSVFDTNPSEGTEFFLNLGLVDYLFGFIFLLITIVYYKTAKPYKAPKLAYVIIVPLFLYTLLVSWPGTMVRDFIRFSNRYIVHHGRLVESIKKPDSWTVSSADTLFSHQNNVLIIGESVRRDYLSVYGYNHPTTPWLNNANGIFIDGFVAMGANTVAALSHTLQQQKNHQTIPENNIITLANKAGYHTHWISNQGRLGRYDTSTSAVAMRAQDYYFLNKGSWNDANHDDFLLLEHLDNALKAAPDDRNLIVLHMLGSHPLACERLHDYPQNFSIGYSEEIDCYLATLQKTDTFIQKVAERLANEGNYSILYLSDHGVSVTSENLKHSDDIANNYQVPLILIDSDATSHQLVRKNISGIHFINIFASWLGIDLDSTSTPYNLREPQIIPDDEQIQVYRRDRLQNIQEIPTEPIV